MHTEVDPGCLNTKLGENQCSRKTGAVDAGGRGRSLDGGQRADHLSLEKEVWGLMLVEVRKFRQ
jgi:hypothetical protein